MTLARLEPFSMLPHRWRRMLELDGEADGWLRVEEVREDGELVVRAEVPGIDPEKDVEVSVSDSTLHISAKREEHAEHKGKRSYRSEFRYGEFQRDVPLPAGVKAEAVKADYKNGILEVRVPWPKETEKPVTKIAVGRS